MRINLDILLLCLSAASAVDAAKKYARSHHKCPALSTQRSPKHPPRAACSKHLAEDAEPTGKRKFSRRVRSTHHPGPFKGNAPHTVMHEPVQHKPHPHFSYEPEDALAAPLSASTDSSTIALTSLSSDRYVGSPLGNSPAISTQSVSSTSSMEWDIGLPLQGTPSPSLISSASSASSIEFDIGLPLEFTQSSTSQPSASSALSNLDAALPLGGSLSTTFSTSSTAAPIALPLPSSTTINPLSSPGSSILSFGLESTSTTIIVSTSGSAIGFSSMESSFVTAQVSATLEASSQSELLSSSESSSSAEPSMGLFSVSSLFLVSAPCAGQTEGQCILVGSTPMRVHCDTFYVGKMVLQGSFEECLDQCSHDGCKSMSYSTNHFYCFTRDGTPSDASAGDNMVGLIEDSSCAQSASSISFQSIASASAEPASSGMLEVFSSVSPSLSPSSSPVPVVYNVNCETGESNDQCIQVGKTPMRVHCDTFYIGMTARLTGTFQDCAEQCASENCKALLYDSGEACYTSPSDTQTTTDQTASIGLIYDEKCAGTDAVGISGKLLKRLLGKVTEVSTLSTSFDSGFVNHVKNIETSLGALESTLSTVATSAVALTPRQAVKSRAIKPSPAPACFAQISSSAPRMCLTSLPSDCQSLANPSISNTVPRASDTDKCRVALTALDVSPPTECFTPSQNVGLSIYMCLVRTVFCTTCITRFPVECRSFFRNTTVVHNATLSTCQTTLGAFGSGPASACFQVGDTVSSLTGVNVGLCIQRLIPYCPSGKCGTPPTMVFETLSASMVPSTSSGLLILESSTQASLSLDPSILSSSSTTGPLGSSSFTFLSSTFVPADAGSLSLDSSMTSQSSVTALISSQITTPTPTATRTPCVNAIPDVCQVPDSDQLSPLFATIDLTECQTALDSYGTPNPAEDCFSPTAFLSYTGQDFAICLANNFPLCPPCLSKLPSTCLEGRQQLGVQCLVALGSFGQQAATLCFTNGMLNRAVTGDLTSCLTRVLICG
ncbi:hypothetical protein DE146DRAFT_225403 [Phaeosphaeria sp. MPI-PUGE-AT-0046c]|nr:hypothetical protein DE146DRAFT_225403 [Phaeosphaeria sp. MPI-PUGE-AT-0046c]